MNSTPVVPHDPPLTTEDLPGAGGRLGPEPEDFLVDEVLPFAASGTGDHLFVRVEKRCMTTPELIQVLARAARVPEQSIGSAGMKDKHAVTTQWLSLPVRGVDPKTWQLPEGVRVVESSPHQKKLRTGQQLGNRFTIRLVDVAPDGLDRMRRILDVIANRGLFNYFGEQRFGSRGMNLEQALGWLRRGGNDRGPKQRFLRKLYPSVVQSEIFNRYLTARRALGVEVLLPGEVMRLEGTHAMFVVEDPQRESQRYVARDIHPTGPLPGPDMRPASGRALELEQHVITELGLSASEIELLGKFAPGTRRDLIVWPSALEVRELGPEQLGLQFFLPSGSFATQLIRELTRAPWLGARAASSATAL